MSFVRAESESPLYLLCSLSAFILMLQWSLSLYLCMMVFSFSIDFILSTVVPIAARSCVSAGPYIIIILYTGTGSVFRLGGRAGAKRGARQWPGIGDKRKHATASSHIFLILSAHQLIKTTHVCLHTRRRHCLARGCGKVGDEGLEPPTSTV